MRRRRGEKTIFPTKASALRHVGTLGSLAVWRSGSLFCTESSYGGASLPVLSIASAI
jgi:hypothetical protein